MKPWTLTGLKILCLFLVLLSCTRKTVDLYPGQNDFEDISALMTPCPDSALNLLLQMRDSIESTEEPVVRPTYLKYRLLLSEALFKNNYQQPDTFTINKIINFYDSLGTIMHDNKELQFQRARSYYYQGVTRQEQDDIVGTCQAFLNSLEIMETNFAEKDRDYDKIRFMALIYTRLGELFYQEYAVTISKTLYLKSYD
ncbi:MAG: hypothetical protein PHR20_08630 [Bacteroidales bacterium]|nr:hypothetical protein [Bacteroidales bacterium]